MAILDRLSNIFNPGVRAGTQADRLVQQQVQQDIQKQNDRLATYEMRFARDWENTQGPMHQENLAGMEEWKNTVNPADPTLKDYVYLYGTQKGMQIWNDVGFGQGSLGMGKQFDPNNSYVNEEGELVPYVRVADAEQGRFYSAPFTVDGRKFSEVAKEFGPGRMPDDEELAISFNQLEMPWIKYKTDVYQRPQAEIFFDAASAGQKIDWFTENARPQLLNILESEGMVEAQQAKDLETLEAAGAPTEVVGGEPTPSPTTTSAPVFGSVEEFKTQFNKVDPQQRPSSGVLGVPTGTLTGKLNLSRLEGVDTSNYLKDSSTHPLNFSDADWNNMTTNEQANAIKLENQIHQSNLNNAIEQGKSQINQPQNLGKVKNWYKTNESKLKRDFEKDQKLFEEFNADPYAFAKKYSSMNQNELFGKPVAPKDVKSLQQETVVPSTKLDKKTVANIMLAADNQDIVAFTKGIEDLIAGGKLSETGQQTLASVLQQYNNNFQRANDSTKLAIVGDMAASLSSDSLRQFMPYMMRFAQTGKLSFEQDQFALDQAKLLQDQYEFATTQQQKGLEETKISDDANALFKEMAAVDPTEIIGKGYGQRISRNLNRALTSGSDADKAAAEDTVNLFLSKAIQGLASSGFLQNNPITSWLYTDVSPKEFQLPPDVVARDGKNDPITIDRLPDVLSGNIQIKDFVIKGVGDQIQGTPVNRGQIDAAFGVDVSQMLLYNSLLANEGR
jgi:hypothetical protein